LKEHTSKLGVLLQLAGDVEAQLLRLERVRTRNEE